MTAITLSRELQVWAEEEVKAGHARDVEAAALSALSRHVAGLARIRASLDAAKARAEVEGWISEEEAFARLEAIVAEEA